MQRLKLFLLASLAMFMLGAVASAVASAEVTLPLFSVETRGTGTLGKGELSVEGSSVKCASATTEFGAGKKLGTFTVSFKECKGPATVGKCWSLGDPKGEILLGGEWHLVRSKTGIKFPLLWLLFSKEDKEAGGLKPIHLECEKVLQLILIWGNICILINPWKTKTTKYELVIRKEGEKQESREFENNEGAAVKAELVASVDGGEAKPVTEESAENRLTMEKETEIEE
jgi:hypothetical protein